MAIHFQIVEKRGANLRKALVEAMRSGSLETFVAKNRGRKVVHISSSYPGWMKWGYHDGVITCVVLSPKKAGSGVEALSCVSRQACGPIF